MVSKTFSICFYLKKRPGETQKMTPIYLRITVDGKRAEISTNRCCDEPEKWNGSSGRMMGNKESTKVLNAHLQALQNKVYDIYKSLLVEDTDISAEVIKNKLTGTAERSKAILEVFQEHNDQMRALINIEFAPATHRRYKTTLEHTKEFIQWKFNLADISIKKLNYEFISDYEFYLKSVRKCGHNSAIKYLTNFRKIVSICIKKGWLVRDPFYGFRMTIKEVVRETLTHEELERMAAKEFSTARLNITRDVFLFSCYTGLAYIDVFNLKRSEIKKGIDGQKWIFAHRQKTETPFHVPLLEIPLKILDKYSDHPQCVNEDRALPVWSNQKLNEYLKEIADLCGIKKLLTYHMARHTFATTITLNNGVPLETISKMLGHRNIKITQRYAKLLDQKISQDMLQLKEKLSR
jgi:site-specific recombinase XerD